MRKVSITHNSQIKRIQKYDSYENDKRLKKLTYSALNKPYYLTIKEKKNV